MSLYHYQRSQALDQDDEPFYGLTTVADVIAVAGIAAFGLALPAVAIAGPAAGLWTAAAGIALCAVAFAIGAVGQVRP